jgi:hypothetical protein
MQLKKYPYSDILGWSASRYDKFKTCQRQYYFDYYAKKHDKSIDLNAFLKLKQLTSVPLEVGNLVHDIVKIILERLAKNSSEINREKLLAFSENLIENYCESKDFIEEYYNEVDKIDKQLLKDKVINYINQFIDSERFKWIIEKSKTLELKWLIEPDGFGETRINNLKAFCKVDFLIFDGGEIYIIDWKTGNEEEQKHRQQLLGYTAFACDHFNVKAEDVKCMLYYFKDQYEKLISFTSEDVRQFSETIKLQTEEMYNLTSNFKSNIPLTKEEFKKTEDNSVCHKCNFKEICLNVKN